MAAHLVSQDVVPIGSGYLILMGVLAAGLRIQRRSAAGSVSQPQGERAPGRVARRFRSGWLRLWVHVAGTAAGGYLLLMAVVVLYYYGVARVAGQFLESAFTGSALLLAISLPAFAVASWLVERRRRGRHGTNPPLAEGAEKPASPPGGLEP